MSVVSRFKKIDILISIAILLLSKDGCEVKLTFLSPSPQVPAGELHQGTHAGATALPRPLLPLRL